MIALGIAIEAVAVVLVVLGLLLRASGVGLLWASIAVVLVGLLLASLGVRRARPSRHGWTPPLADRPEVR